MHFNLNKQISIMHQPNVGTIRSRKDTWKEDQQKWKG